MTDPSSQQQTIGPQKALDLAQQHHNAGDLPKAEAIYQQILQTDPNEPVALHLLGVIAHQVGKNDVAEYFIRKALDVKPNYAEAHCNLGLSLQELGKLDEAVTHYHKALAIKPHFLEANFNLGNTLKELGQLGEAIASYHKTCTIKPDYPEAYCNLGVTLKELGKLDEAVASYREALAINPNYTDAHYNLGNALKELGQLNEAVASYHKALAIKTDYAEVHYNLANVLQDLEKLDTAVTSYREALVIKPDYVEAYNNLGIALYDLGKLDEAMASCYKALAINPVYAEAHNNLGNMLKELGQFDEAVAHYHEAVEIKPDDADARNNLGIVLTELGKLDEAIVHYHEALGVKPEFAEAHNNLGNALRDLGKLDESVSSYRKALAIKPDYVEAHNNLGNAFQDLGMLDEAISNYRRALAIEPDLAEVGRHYLLVILYVPGLTPGELFVEHLRFSENHTQDIILPTENLSNDPTPDRRLRVGYLSSDFRNHPVGHNILPLLTSHDRVKFEVFCYADIRRPDETTKRFKSCADHWRTIVGKSDPEVAEMVRADRIDVLVCLAGRFDGNRPMVCANRAAPVQVSWHDGATSGLKEIDYLLTDSILNPPDTKETFTEQLHRLPVFYQYPQIEGVTPVAKLPSTQAGFITFGSFNNPAKVNGEVIHLWAEVLRSVPDSRLLLKYKNWYGQVSLRDRVVERFVACGIDSDRVTFTTSVDTIEEHLGRYAKVDIALDTFPFNGATTTFQALWMGVPVVSLFGETFISRAAGSILHHGGLKDLVADTPEAYVTCARDLAGDHERLGTLRANLRDQIATSPLCDAYTYSLSVESAYRDMWLKWCVQNKTSMT